MCVCVCVGKGVGLGRRGASTHSLRFQGCLSTDVAGVSQGVAAGSIPCPTRPTRPTHFPVICSTGLPEGQVQWPLRVERGRLQTRGTADAGAAADASAKAAILHACRHRGARARSSSLSSSRLKQESCSRMGILIGPNQFVDQTQVKYDSALNNKSAIRDQTRV